MTTNLVAIILAGNDNNPEILGGGAGPSKLFMEFNESKVCDKTIEAVDGLEDFSSIYVVCPPGYIEKKFTTKHPLRLLQQGHSRTENMMIAVNAAAANSEYKQGDYVLLVMGDLPLLNTESIESFISACQTAKTADAYIGLIPVECLHHDLAEYYRQDFLPINNGIFIHSDVYLIKPSSITEVGLERFERIMNIRRLNRDNLGEVIKAGMEIIKIAKLRGLLTFGKVITGLYFYNNNNHDMSYKVLDGVEAEVKRIFKDFFGPEIEFVYIDKPELGYEFDTMAQLQALEEHAHN